MPRVYLIGGPNGAGKTTAAILYLWLPSVDLALQRVAQRVASGGHDVPEDVIRARFDRGRANAFRLYLPLADYWSIHDNSGLHPRLIAQGGASLDTVIVDGEVWKLVNAGLE